MLSTRATEYISFWNVTQRGIFKEFRYYADITLDALIIALCTG